MQAEEGKEAVKKTVIVNIYNFIRMSHVEPSVFIPDDFETVRKQMILIRQYDLPATYALKYDALMEPRYQELIKTYAGSRDEISAWWEITEALCVKAGVDFCGAGTEEYDDRVNSAYCIGYGPEERKKLVDAYMADFYQVFGFYPKTIGSWVLDTVTVSYAAEKYGILGSAICRDQMGTDGFTLWGGFPTGIYYPSRKNENIPGNTKEGQVPVPMFRLLGPDPIYNFEQDVRSGLQGVYTLEPSWLIGRNPEWISWYFGCLTGEDSLGVGYAHVGQENNFLWENIRPGMEPQLKKLKELLENGCVRIETMAESAAWFSGSYKLTPPMTFQASADWDKGRNLSAQWYACSNYRLGFLGEKGHLRIRDFFLYRQEYPSRYLEAPMTNAKSTFDALPVLFPQIWVKERGERPFIRLLDEEGREPAGVISYKALDDMRAQAVLAEEEGEVRAVFTMSPEGVLLEGNYRLHMDCLPVFRSLYGGKIQMEHEGYYYDFSVEEGSISTAEAEGVEICPERGRIFLKLGQKTERGQVMTDLQVILPERGSRETQEFAVPPISPAVEPRSCIFAAGTTGKVELAAQEAGEIRYTLDGTEPGEDAALYCGPLELRKDTVVSAKLFLPDGRCSETVTESYRFGIQGIRLTSSTVFDVRPVFGGNGIGDLTQPLRGSLDYLDGRWRGTLQNLEVCGELPEPMYVETITAGFLSHHRSGIIYPKSLRLYTGRDEAGLTLTAEVELPCEPCAREIARQDITFSVGQVIGCFRLEACRYRRMPQWCCYRGTKGVFTMVDNIIVSPGT